MPVIRIICLLGTTGLVVASLGWAVGNGFSPGAAATAIPEGTVPADAEKSAHNDSESAARNPLELTTGLHGFRMPCMDCHKHLGLPPKDPVGHGKGPHESVVLHHGHNNHCYNCHHPSSDGYGSFVDHDGSMIPIESVEKLCAKCHGPHYRAWKNGSHGQRTGHWNTDLGQQTTARCNACHDPHWPYFKPIPTMPGPRSLHGEPSPDHPCRKRD